MQTSVIPQCPECHSSANVIPIRYGMPGPQLLEQAKQGKVKLGGCVIRG